MLCWQALSSILYVFFMRLLFSRKTIALFMLMCKNHTRKKMTKTWFFTEFNKFQSKSPVQIFKKSWPFIFPAKSEYINKLPIFVTGLDHKFSNSKTGGKFKTQCKIVQFLEQIFGRSGRERENSFSASFEKISNSFQRFEFGHDNIEIGECLRPKQLEPRPPNTKSISA